MRFTFRSFNRLFGFLVFCIAASTYCLTIESGVSFWDCAEFIVSAYKLEVGHPPGAPFFMLTANVFTQFTDNPATVARMVNYMSALLSAATILFLYFTITHLVRKLIVSNTKEISAGNAITIIATGIVGALAYTWSDTFWFSAVEGEVYAYSSLFTALVFWLILKWEDETDSHYADRWLILIAYLTGLSIGVHLLNLLCLPAIVLVYYYKKNPESNWKGTLGALSFSAVLVIAVLYGIVPGVVKVGGWMELLFTNQLAMGYNSGLIFYIILLLAVIAWGIYESRTGKSDTRIKASFLLAIALTGIPFYGYGWSSLLIGGIVLFALYLFFFSKRIFPRFQLGRQAINTTLLCLLMILAGYSSYTVIVLRSAANTPMDQNSPEDIFTLGSFLAREQYGQRPLFYGPAFSSERKLIVENGYCKYDYKQGKPNYTRKIKQSPDEKDEYVISGYSYEPVYEHNMFLPRMYSADHANYGPNQTNLYRQWVDIKGRNLPYDRCGEPVMVNMPTQWENIQFFFTYQLNFMYWRYFMWNFAGRQNDIQSHGELEHGNWITGIPFIDHLLVGNQENIPTDLKENKGRNVFYCLPLLLGLLGIAWQLKQGKGGKQSFFIVFFLFFMTGIAIILYLNQTPMQVRERDYAYAGSFYAFCIWIGMGVAAIRQVLGKKIKQPVVAAIVAGAASLAVPLQMVSETWDDHDRSGRYLCRDFGRNYLESAPEGNHPIIFTHGDNDTFPLWYNQEVEEFRTDARTCNFAYLQTDWYIDQMKRDYYNSPKLPIKWEKSEYATGVCESVPVRPEMKAQIDALYKAYPEQARQQFGDNPYELQNILRYWVRAKDEKLRMIPTDSIVIKLDKEAIRRSGMQIPAQLNGEIPDYMHLSLAGRPYLTKNELMMLEIIAGSNWERPVFIAVSTGPEPRLCFEDNLCQEGLLYRVTPFNTTRLGARMDSEKTYHYLMNTFQWGGLQTEGLYIDESAGRMCIWCRRLFASLAERLIKEGKIEKARDVLCKCIEVIPHYNYPYDYQNGAWTLAKCFYQIGDNENGDKIRDILVDKSSEYVRWYQSMGKSRWNGVKDNCMYHLYLLEREYGR